MNNIDEKRESVLASGVVPLDKLATALAAFQAEMPTVAKRHTAQVKSDKGSYSYTYAGLADVTEAAMPLLAKHGLSFVTLPGNGELTGYLLHSSGQALTASLPINGSTPQQVGSALTYMRRYLFGCMTGIVTDDDDDGRTAQNARPVRAKATPVTSEATDDNAVTPAQLGKIGALMSEVGITDRDEALGYVAKAIGRQIGSRKELTKKEASTLIEHLDGDRSLLAAPLAGDDDV